MPPSLPSIIARIKLKQLRLLILLDETGTLHRAAERAAMTQSGATKALQEIEATLGAPLFERSSQGMRANDLGHCVIRYARLIHTDLAHLQQEMASILQGYGGRLAVGAIMGAVPSTLTQAVVRLRAVQPQLSIEIIEDTSARLLSLVAEGRLDLAICRASVSQRPDLFDFDVLDDEPITVVAHPSHPLASASTTQASGSKAEKPARKPPALQLADLADMPWIVYPSNMPMRALLERAFAEAGLSMPSYPIETASTFATLSLLQADPTLVALVPVDVGTFCERFGLATILNLALGARTEPFGIATRRGGTPSPAARMLIEQLRAGTAHH